MAVICPRWRQSSNTTTGQQPRNESETPCRLTLASPLHSLGGPVGHREFNFTPNADVFLPDKTVLLWMMPNSRQDEGLPLSKSTSVKSWFIYEHLTFLHRTILDWLLNFGDFMVERLGISGFSQAWMLSTIMRAFIFYLQRFLRD